jgi:hypothetical protein
MEKYSQLTDEELLLTPSILHRRMEALKIRLVIELKIEEVNHPSKERIYFFEKKIKEIDLRIRELEPFFYYKNNLNPDLLELLEKLTKELFNVECEGGPALFELTKPEEYSDTYKDEELKSTISNQSETIEINKNKAVEFIKISERFMQLYYEIDFSSLIFKSSLDQQTTKKASKEFLNKAIYSLNAYIGSLYILEKLKRRYRQSPYGITEIAKDWVAGLEKPEHWFSKKDKYVEFKSFSKEVQSEIMNLVIEWQFELERRGETINEDDLWDIEADLKQHKLDELDFLGYPYDIDDRS